ncbi:MAG TPA: dienelactone hydrolase family protein [Candidatus Paceibacterota bacterium]|nr:dienelactone hydrolase family protein [Candidatus Paceibacterota bacterium]
METITLDTSNATSMPVHAARPKGKATKGIIVVQEAFGVNDYIKRIAGRFAKQGFLAVAPELFHRSAPAGFEGSYTDYQGIMPHMQALTDEGILADITAAYEWLAAEGVSKDRIAVIGFCMGGRASFLANASLPVAAAVSFYGGGIAQTLLPRAKNLHAPQLLMWGGKDTHILPEHVRAVSDALTAAGKPFVEATFSEAGHGFACDARDAYHKPSADLAWVLADAFIAERLP